jgi:hypothetical protein
MLLIDNYTRPGNRLWNLNFIPMFIARKSNHINEDIARNWSSWNFGEGGFHGTYEELQAELATVTDSSCVFISGFEIYADAVKGFEFGELYPGYWVAIDRTNAAFGISGIELDAEDLQEAIAEATNRTDYFGQGICFDARKATLVHSDDDIHIFEL